jgi:glutathione S-transferase
MVLTLYADKISSPCRAIIAFLDVCAIPFEYHHIDLKLGAHKQAEYLAINPLGYVPAISDDGFVLCESPAILTYLAEKYERTEPWFPKEIERRAAVNQFISWYHLHIRLFGAKWVLYEHFAKATGRAVPAQAI